MFLSFVFRLLFKDSKEKISPKKPVIQIASSLSQCRYLFSLSNSHPELSGLRQQTFYYLSQSVVRDSGWALLGSSVPCDVYCSISGVLMAVRLVTHVPDNVIHRPSAMVRIVGKLGLAGLPSFPWYLGISLAVQHGRNCKTVEKQTALYCLYQFGWFTLLQ